MQFVVKIISVEPFIFLASMAFFVQAISMQSLVIRKFCLVRLNLNESDCVNLTQNDDMEEKVQKLTVNFNLIKILLDTIPAVVFSIFVGSFSDRFGRKTPMLLTCVGGSVSMTIVIVNAYWLTEIAPEVLALSSLPMGFTGGIMAIMATGACYISDISSPETRTIRMAFMQMAFMLATPIGISIGGIILDQFGYIAVFGTSLSLYIIGFIYVAIVIKETIQRQSQDKNKNLCSSFFDLQNVKSSWKTLIQKREKNHRVHIFLIIVVMTINLFPVFGEHSIALLYTRKRYKWNELTYSLYTTAVLAANAVGLMVGVPIFTTFFKFSDATIGFIATISKICNDLILGFAIVGWMFFAACPFAVFSGILSPVTRSMMSKCVKTKELGKVYSLVGACESVAPAIAGVLYSLIYNNTRHSESTVGAVYFVSAGLYLIPLILLRYIISNMAKHEKKHEEKSDNQILHDTRF